jgi:hypothetical protein
MHQRFHERVVSVADGRLTEMTFAVAELGKSISRIPPSMQSPELRASAAACAEISKLLALREVSRVDMERLIDAALQVAALIGKGRPC